MATQSEINNNTITNANATKSKSLRIAAPATIRNTTLTTNKPFLEIDQYNIAIQRLTSGYSNLSDLAVSLKDRATLEQNYANALKNWSEKTSKIMIKGGEYNTTRQSWLDGLDEARSLSQIHSTISENIMEKPYKKILEWQKTHYHSKLMGGFKEVERFDKDFRKAQKPWVKLYKSQTLAKKNYHNNCMKRKTGQNQLENLRLQLRQAEETLSPKVEGKAAAVEKQQGVLGQIEKDVEKSREEYNKTVDDCSKYTKTYESEMKTVYDKTQAEEEGRLRFIKDLALEIHEQLNLNKNANYAEVYKKHLSDLKKMSPENDVKWWNNARGLGVKMNWPVFEEYDPESLMKSVAYNQSQRASKHLAGSTNIETVGYKSTSEDSSIKTSATGDNFGKTLVESPKKEAGSGDAIAYSQKKSTKNVKSSKLVAPQQAQRTEEFNEFSEENININNPMTSSAMSNEKIMEASIGINGVNRAPMSPETREVHASLNTRAYNGWDESKRSSNVSPTPVVVLYNYEAVEDDELTLLAGTQILRLEDVDDQGWCKGQLPDGVVGLFPAEYVKEVE